MMKHKTVLFFMVANILSKPIGLLRQVVFAAFYGVSAIMGSFRFAQTISLAFMNFFTADILTAGFLPLYERYKKTCPILSQCYFWYLFILLSLLSISICAVLYLFAPTLVHWFAPGFTGQAVTDSIQFIRIFSYSVPLCLLGTLLSYLAMSHGAYFGVSTRPMFESVGLTLGVIYSVWYHHVLAIAWAFVFTYVVFFCLISFICYQQNLLQRISWDVLSHNIKTLGKEFWQTIRPLLILPLFMQSKFIIEKMLASLMAISVVASLDYSRFIIESGMNVLAMPVSMFGLAAFSVMDEEKLLETLKSIFFLLLIVSLPITLFLVLNSKLIVTVLFGYGVFGASAIDESNIIFLGMSIGFFANVLSYFLVKVLSSQLENKRLLQYLVFALFCNILFIVSFFRILGPLSLGLGESIYAIVVFTLCTRYFRLGEIFKEMLILIAPASLIYSGIALQLSLILPNSAWQAFICQSLLFIIYWAVVLLSLRKTRELILSFQFGR